MLVWGGTFTSARMLGNELDPIISAFLRFLLASSILVAYLYYKEKHLPRITTKQFIGLLGMGLSGIALYNLFFFYGLVHAEASRGSLITSTNPLLTALGSALLFKERFTLIRIIGFVLCIFGAILIISRGDLTLLLNEGIGLGEMSFIGCSFSWAAYTLIGRFVSKDLSSLLVIAYASVFGTVILFFVAILTKGSGLFVSIAGLSMSAISHLIYLAVFATVFGFVWFQEGIKVLGAAKAAVFIYFMPVSAVFLAYLILHEKLTLVLILGASLVISGIYLVNKKGS